MLGWLFLLSITAAPTVATPAYPSIERMTALYDAVCLQTFPDDTAIAGLLQTRGARPLTPDQVKVTLRDDPGRGWELQDNGRPVFVFLELPPYHSCSVRWSGPTDQIDLTAYEQARARFLATGPKMKGRTSHAADRDDLHIHATVEERALPDGAVESLMVFDQHTTNAARRASGETGYDLRFVRQIFTAH